MAKKTTKPKPKEEVKVEEKAAVEEAPIEPEIKVAAVQIAAPIDPSNIHIMFTKEEIDTFANLLIISAQMYQQLALSSAEQNDEKSFNILSARQKLSAMLAGKFATSSAIGEPTSRDIH